MAEITIPLETLDKLIRDSLHDHLRSHQDVMDEVEKIRQMETKGLRNKITELEKKLQKC